VPHYSSLQNGIKMLNDRIEVLIQYLKEVKTGDIKKDFETLRQIKSLTYRLPTIDSEKFATEYINVRIKLKI
jgi:COP9 signalosome complex subunit 6